eukprot:6099826-Amphidinium_carterae.2
MLGGGLANCLCWSAGSAAPTSLLVETPGNAEQHALPSVESAMGSERFHRTSRLVRSCSRSEHIIVNNVSTNY